MAIAGGIGGAITLPKGVAAHAFLFGEDQARYLVTTRDPGAVLAAAAKAGVPAFRLGATGGGALTVDGGNAISVEELRLAHEGWLPQYMSAP
jgi:hypothetical protein